jgi:ketosteroid isomerase-like protein
MRKWILALAISFIAFPAAASHVSGVMATVKQYNDDFNKGDIAAAVALCTPQTIIIDDFAPHAWQGASACSDWASALAAYDKKVGITNEAVALGRPLHVSVTGDRGYAVYPTTYTYKRDAMRMTEQGVWTFALQRLPAGWRITGWAWAQH